MKKYLLVVFFVATITLVRSQTLELQETMTTTMYRASGGSSSNPFHRFKFRESGEYTWRKIGPYGKGLLPYFSSCPPALEELNKYKTKRIIATAAGVSAVGYFMIYAAVDLSNFHKTPSTNPANDNGPNLVPLVGPVMALALLDFIFAATSNANLRKGIDLYNIRQESGSNKIHLLVGSPSTLGLAITYKF